MRTFGKYLLDQEIARGGMSRVHLARLRGLGGFEKRLVVKQILPELASDPRFVDMFVHEANTLVQMSHPHIAPVYELGVVDGVYFLAMEYVDGATLEQILRDGPLAPGLVAHLGAEIGDALHYAHTRFDIVHRDVTPRNVIVDGAGHSRLLDFGIAAPAEGESAELFGTPGYMSPEQLAGDPLGPESDVFSLGAVLFEALTGRRAFRAKTVEDHRSVLGEEGPRFEDDDGVPEELAEIVGRALARDPGTRPESARDLVRALRGWLASHAPEGVGPELGQRSEAAERAHGERKAADVPDEEGLDEPQQPSEIKTLATSRLLHEILESERPPPPSLELDSGTVPLEGRRSRATPVPASEPAASEPPGTRPIEGRNSRPGTPREGDEPERTSHEERDAQVRRDEPQPLAPAPAPGGSRIAVGVSTALVLALLGVVAWVSWPAPPGGSSDPRVDGPPVDVGGADPGGAIDEGAARDGVVEADGARDGGVDPGARVEAEGTPAQTENAVPSETANGTAGTMPESGSPAGRRSGEPGEGEVTSATARATLSVNATPWAEVRLDGRSLGTTPQRRVALRPGDHTVELSCPPLGRQVRARFTADPGDSLTVIADLTVEPPTIQVR